MSDLESPVLRDGLVVENEVGNQDAQLVVFGALFEASDQLGGFVIEGESQSRARIEVPDGDGVVLDRDELQRSGEKLVHGIVLPAHMVGDVAVGIARNYPNYSIDFKFCQ